MMMMRDDGSFCPGGGPQSLPGRSRGVWVHYSCSSTPHTWVRQGPGSSAAIPGGLLLSKHAFLCVRSPRDKAGLVSNSARSTRGQCSGSGSFSATNGLRILNSESQALGFKHRSLCISENTCVLWSHRPTTLLNKSAYVPGAWVLPLADLTLHVCVSFCLPEATSFSQI